MDDRTGAATHVKSPPGKGEFRILPNKRAVEVEGGGVWEMPHDELDPDESSLEWRLRYASPETIVKERMVLACIVSCYRELIWCTEDRRKQVIRSLRAAHLAGAR